MGGDHAPGITVRGSAQALAADPDLRVLLVGDTALLEAEIQKLPERPPRLELVASGESISMDDHAVSAARKKRDSSIHKGIGLVKAGEARAFLSAGNSGAVMAVALLELGRLPQVERPAIAVRFPTAEGFVVLLDVGANVDCRPAHLVQFAQMGELFSRVIEGIANPRIALLSNGSETHKGNELTRHTHEQLSRLSGLNYQGYAEGSDLFRGVADVVVCDGFVGNALLKTSEGLVDTLQRWLRKRVGNDFFSRLGVLLLRRTLREFRRKFDYQPYGAAPLLGIEGMVLISHGSSTDTAIRNGILTAKRGVQEDFVRKMRSTLRGTES
ncbi:phosphate acyltransferase PlsX [bacterium]|nr:phosphate acyltransferase PlsX [bacterium]